MVLKDKYVFNLSGFNFKEIIETFIKSKNNDDNELILDFSTSTEVINNNYTKNYTMCDFSKIESDGVLPLQTDKCCWWCRHKFNTVPIGLPINYYPNESKNLIGENIKSFFEKKNIIFETNDFFETEGVFCSFECCKAYIIDNKSIYTKSLTLLSLLFQKINGSIPENIEIAPSWKLLKNYGGELEIEEFRKTFVKDFDLTINVKRPYQFIIGNYFESKK